jgi:type I restriction enzyme S subunit
MGNGQLKMDNESLGVQEASARYKLSTVNSQLVPPGFKQTELGEIPEEWECRPIRSFSAFVTKGATPTTYGFGWENDGVLFLRSECVSDDGLDLAQSMFISASAHVALIRGEVRSGDILMTITGNVGRVVRLKADFGLANINQHIARIRVIDSDVLPNFVYHWLSQPGVRAYYTSITTGQAYPQISLRQVRETKVPLPPLPEQRAIAAALSDVDALLAKLDQLIAKKRDLKQAAKQQLLTGQQRLPGFSGEWEVKRLGEIGTFTKGKGIKKDEVVADGLPCIRYGEIYTHHNDYIQEFHSFIPPRVARESQRLRKGDLLFAGSGETAEEIGKCVAFLGNEEAYAGGDIVILSAAGQNAMYLGYLMNHTSFVEQKARLGQGDAVVHISGRNLSQVKLRLPLLSEQTAIATVLSDMDAEIAALEARRDKTRALKQGMMQELLTGRTRLV